MTNQDTLKCSISILFYGVNVPDNNHEYIINNIFSNYKNIECDYILVGQEDQSEKNYDGYSEQKSSIVFAYRLLHDAGNGHVTRW